MRFCSFNGLEREREGEGVCLRNLLWQRWRRRQDSLARQSARVRACVSMLSQDSWPSPPPPPFHPPPPPSLSLSALALRLSARVSVFSRRETERALTFDCCCCCCCYIMKYSSLSSNFKCVSYRVR